MPNISPILDVAIGLVFVFSLLSLIATWLQEYIATLFKLRSKHLANIIQNLLDPSTEKLAGVKELEKKWEEGIGDKVILKLKSNAVKAFYEHPIIRGLSAPKRLPSYIDPRDFGTALFDLLTKAGTEDSSARNELEALKAGIGKLGNETTEGALLALLKPIEAIETKTEKRIAAARHSIESWFDATADRATGWYKRSASRLAILIGIVLAVAFNADSIGLAQTLWGDTALRDSLVAASTAYVEQGEDGKASDAQEKLDELGLPIGWSLQTDDNDPNTPVDPRDFPSSAGGWVLKSLGLLLTGFAVSQGSPFWFDFLNRFTNMRGTGKKPESD